MGDKGLKIGDWTVIDGKLVEKVGEIHGKLMMHDNMTFTCPFCQEIHEFRMVCTKCGVEFRLKHTHPKIGCEQEESNSG